MARAFGVPDARLIMPNPCTCVCPCCERPDHVALEVLGAGEEEGPETPRSSFYGQKDVHKLSDPNNIDKFIKHIGKHLGAARKAEKIVPDADDDGRRAARAKVAGFEYACATLKKQPTSHASTVAMSVNVLSDRVPACYIADLP